MRVLPTIRDTSPTISTALPNIAKNYFSNSNEELIQSSQSQTVFMNPSADEDYQAFDYSVYARNKSSCSIEKYGQSIQLSDDVYNKTKHQIINGKFSCISRFPDGQPFLIIVTIKYLDNILLLNF